MHKQILNSTFITSYERDNETDLDFAQARMHDYNLGRFTSPDSFANDTLNSAPQSWNLYVYVRNNPLKFNDPTGKFVWGDSLGGNRTEEDLSKTEEGRQILERRAVIIGAISVARATLLLLTPEQRRERGISDGEYAQMQRAVNSYGFVDDDNGVTIEFGNIDGDSVGTTGFGKDKKGDSEPFTYSFNADGTSVTEVKANIVVKFEVISEDIIVHEGSHVADRQALASDFSRDANNDQYIVTNSNFNLTQYQTENRAYNTESNFNRARGSGTTRNQREINNFIRNGYTDSQNRRVTPNNEGDRFLTIQRRQQ